MILLFMLIFVIYITTVPLILRSFFFDYYRLFAKLRKKKALNLKTLAIKNRVRNTIKRIYIRLYSKAKSVQYKIYLHLINNKSILIVKNIVHVYYLLPYWLLKDLYKYILQGLKQLRYLPKKLIHLLKKLIYLLKKLIDLLKKKLINMLKHHWNKIWCDYYELKQLRKEYLKKIKILDSNPLEIEFLFFLKASVIIPLTLTCVYLTTTVEDFTYLNLAIVAIVWLICIVINWVIFINNNVPSYRKMSFKDRMQKVLANWRFHGSLYIFSIAFMSLCYHSSSITLDCLAYPLCNPFIRCCGLVFALFIVHFLVGLKQFTVKESFYNSVKRIKNLSNKEIIKLLMLVFFLSIAKCIIFIKIVPCVSSLSYYHLCKDYLAEGFECGTSLFSGLFFLVHVDEPTISTKNVSTPTTITNITPIIYNGNLFIRIIKVCGCFTLVVLPYINLCLTYIIQLMPTRGVLWCESSPPGFDRPTFSYSTPTDMKSMTPIFHNGYLFIRIEKTCGAFLEICANQLMWFYNRTADTLNDKHIDYLRKIGWEDPDANPNGTNFWGTRKNKHPSSAFVTYSSLHFTTTNILKTTGISNRSRNVIDILNIFNPSSNVINVFNISNKFSNLSLPLNSGLSNGGAIGNLHRILPFKLNDIWYLKIIKTNGSTISVNHSQFLFIGRETQMYIHGDIRPTNLLIEIINTGKPGAHNPLLFSNRWFYLTSDHPWNTPNPELHVPFDHMSSDESNAFPHDYFFIDSISDKWVPSRYIVNSTGSVKRVEWDKEYRRATWKLYNKEVD